MNELSFRARIAIVLLVAIIVIVVFRQQSSWVEAVYYHGLYPFFSYLIRPLVNFLPFSIGDLAYLCLIMALIAGVIRVLRFLITKRLHRLKLTILEAIVLFQGLWLAFYLFWGLNYYRPAAAQTLKLNDTSYRVEDVVKVAALVIDSANACREKLNAADLQQSDKQIFDVARSAVWVGATVYPEFKIVSPRVKSSIFSALLNYMGTSGYYNPFSAEAQLNNMMPVFDKPFTACHEMGHQMGWAREDEANFAGYVCGVKSNNKLLRYSSYYTGIGEFMRYLRRRDSVAYKALRQRISPKVIQDFKTDSAYWVQYSGAAQTASGIFYDNFLKANNQPRGLHTYNRMILLTMAWYRKEYHAW